MSKSYHHHQEIFMKKSFVFKACNLVVYFSRNCKYSKCNIIKIIHIVLKYFIALFTDATLGWSHAGGALAADFILVSSHVMLALSQNHEK